MKEYCVYGNPTIDIITKDEGRETIAYGGGSYYSSIPLLERNLSVKVYAVYSPLLTGHPIGKYIVKQQYSTRINIFRLIYRGLERELKIIDNAPPIYPWNVNEDYCYAVVNPVIGEVDLNLLREIRHRSLLLAIDLQGFLREKREGKIFLTHSPIALYAVEVADVVHADLEEFRALTVPLSPSQAFDKISKHVKGVLLITDRPNTVFLVNRRGVRVYTLEEKYNAINKTGAGDYFLSTYFYLYISTVDEEEAIFKAHEYTTKWLIVRNSRGPPRTLTTH